MAPSSPSGGLTVEVSNLLEYALATVEGTIAFGSHVLLEEELTRGLTLARGALIIDLAAVEFCDSSGLGVFARIVRQARMRGITLVVVGIQGRVANVFHMTRMEEAVYLKPDLEAAIRWLETGRAGAEPARSPEPP